MPNNTHETLPITTLVLILNSTNKPINDKYIQALYIIRNNNLNKTYYIDNNLETINILTEEYTYRIMEKNNYLYINNQWKIKNIAQQLELELKDL